MSGTTKTLGDELRDQRMLKGLSLRQVEKLSGISNAYLSQLETGKVKSPSASTLHSLSQVYGLTFELLLTAAGIIQETTKNDSETNDPLTVSGHALRSKDLTAEEEEELVEYLMYIRSKARRKQSK